MLGAAAEPPIEKRPDSHEELWKFLDRTAYTEDQWLDGKAEYIREEMSGVNDIEGRIGMGAQYVVYEIPGNRVFKVAHNQTSASKELKRQGHNDDDGSVEEILDSRDEGARYVKQLCTWSEKARVLFGNPVFNGKSGESGAFEQDKVTIPDLAFKEMSVDSQLIYIYSYIRSLKNMWRLGCSDRTFNFEVNTGISESGRLVISDFGEMDFDKEAVAKTLRQPRWEYAWGCKILDPEVREQAFELFSKELTVDELDRIWCEHVNTQGR